EDQVRVHRVAKRHLSNGNAGRRRLQADRPLLLIRPKPPCPPRHACTLVSTIVGGHYPALSPHGRAVSPDAYDDYRGLAKPLERRRYPSIAHSVHVHFGDTRGLAHDDAQTIALSKPGVLRPSACPARRGLLPALDRRA